MPWPIKTCPSRMRSLPSPRHCLKNFTTDNFNQGSQVVHPFHLAARTCLPCAARPRCHVQPVVASTGFHCIFLEGVFTCPAFKASARGSIGLLPTQLCVRNLELRPPAAFDSRFMRQHSRQGQPAKFASRKTFFGKLRLVV